jgi:hypothetical protein
MSVLFAFCVKLQITIIARKWLVFEMINSDVTCKSFNTLKCFGTQRADKFSILIDLGMVFVGV